MDLGMWTAAHRSLSRLPCSQNVVWYVVKTCCERAGLQHIAPHDLRRTCAKLCHTNGGEIEQIQFLLGHASVQTTERYLGCKQRSTGTRMLYTNRAMKNAVRGSAEAASAPRFPPSTRAGMDGCS